MLLNTTSISLQSSSSVNPLAILQKNKSIPLRYSKSTIYRIVLQYQSNVNEFFVIPGFELRALKQSNTFSLGVTDISIKYVK